MSFCMFSEVKRHQKAAQHFQKDVPLSTGYICPWILVSQRIIPLKSQPRKGPINKFCTVNCESISTIRHKGYFTTKLCQISISDLIAAARVSRRPGPLPCAPPKFNSSRTSDQIHQIHQIHKPSVSHVLRLSNL